MDELQVFYLAILGRRHRSAVEMLETNSTISWMRSSFFDITIGEKSKTRDGLFPRSPSPVSFL
jgi:hypothetical protein